MEVKRLSKIAREFNVGISTMIEFLHKKGFNDVKFNPNTKIEADVYDVLIREFAPDLKAKEEKEEVSERRHSKEKHRETVTLEEGPHAQVSLEDDQKSNAIQTVVPEEDKPRFKVIDKIDLDAINKPKAKAKKEEIVEEPEKKEVVKPKVEEAPVVEAKVDEKPVVVETPKVETLKVESKKTEAPKEEIPVVKAPVSVVEQEAIPVEEARPEKVIATEKKEVKEVVAKAVVEEAKPVVKSEPVIEQEGKIGSEIIAEAPVVQEIKEKEIVKKVPVEDKTDEVTTPVQEKKEEDFIPTKAKLQGEIKVVDKIDLSLLNQRTRPPKKSKEERKKEREDREKQRRGQRPEDNKPQQGQGQQGSSDDVFKPNKVRLNGPKVVTKINLDAAKAADAKGGDAARPKRKRIHKDKEKVNIIKPGQTGQPGQTGTARPDRSPKRVKRPVKNEVNEGDVQKQIKDTLARLTNKGKSKGAKYRRDKRDAVSERHQAEMDRLAEDKKKLKIAEFVTANELAIMMSVPVNKVISTFMTLGMFVSINQRLDAETISLVAEEFGYGVEFVSADVAEAIQEEEDREEDLIPRPPIVTVMGHVDHGKTSLLDYIRNANVIAGESGGITQHIGAYNVQLDDGRKITFLDTPGHEAFTAMRARGAKVTDIAIIIVAADDDVMPQTIEAINHAAAAEVPIVFAINKIDKPGANVDRVKEKLATMNYLVEEWGGKYQSHDISAKQGIGITELLEKVLLEAEMLEAKANPNKKASGSVIESSLDKGKGYVATVLVQNGTLRQGDIVLAGQAHGHIKAMFNERTQRVKEAGPSEPVLILGLNGAPQAGDNFNVMDTEKEAREIATKREQLQREQGVRAQKHITLDEIGRRIAIGNFQELNIIVKGDVDGSVEALSDALIKLSTEEIQVNIKHKAVGQISESDVILAAATDAIVIGFQVRPSLAARRIAEKEEIDIRLYSIIYDAIEEIKLAMEGMLSPEIKEEVLATLEIRETFNITKVGTIAGCIVREGKIHRKNKVRLIRNGIVIFTGDLGTLKRFKDDVTEVASGYECGCNITGYNNIEIGDMIESFKEVEVSRRL